MRKSPRTRRLEADYAAIKRLDQQSSIFRFECSGTTPELYRLFFHGPGTYKTTRNTVAIRDTHEIVIELGAAYPRLMPGLTWQTPVFHPNISSSGVVCLGGYGTNWVPSLKLDELCIMLWDMIRYKNFDVESPYNREAAMWAREQIDFRFPLDDRSLRDLVSTGTVGVSSTAKPAQQANSVVVNVSSGASMVETETEPAETQGSFQSNPQPPDSPCISATENDGILFLD